MCYCRSTNPLYQIKNLYTSKWSGYATSDSTGNADCTDGLFCTGVETCVAGVCVDGPGDPCGAGETCNEGNDECIPDGCDLEWDMDGDCDVDKDDAKLLKVFHKNEMTYYKNLQKSEKAAMKAAIGSYGNCDLYWDLDGDCDVDKADATLLKAFHKNEMTDLKNLQKAQKAAMKAALK